MKEMRSHSILIELVLNYFAILCSRLAFGSKSDGFAGCLADRDACRCTLGLRRLKCAPSGSFYPQMMCSFYSVAQCGQVCVCLLATRAFLFNFDLLAGSLSQRCVCRCTLGLRRLKCAPSGSFYPQMMLVTNKKQPPSFYSSLSSGIPFIMSLSNSANS